MPGSQPTAVEPHYLKDEKTWKKITCAPFLDTSGTSLVARTIWTPNFPIIPLKYQRRWGEYCLLRRR